MGFGDTPEVHINDVISTDVKMGIVRDTDGSQMLVVFLPLKSTQKNRIALRKI